MRYLAMVMMMGIAGCATVSEPRLSESQRNERVQTLTTLALSYIEQGSFDRAVDPLERALALAPKDQEAMLAKAVMLERQGDVHPAEVAYDQLFDAHPDFTRGRQIYANFLFSIDQIEAACQALEQVTGDTLYSARAQAFENLGQCRDRLGQSDLALAAYERANRLDIRRPLPNLVLAERKFLAGDLQRATYHYGQYVRRAQQTARSLWVGIRIAQATGDQNSQASYELLLRNQFSNSSQYSAWQEWK